MGPKLPRERPLLLTVLSLWMLSSGQTQKQGDLRLTGYGASSLAGRLEVAWNGNWGTVCGTGFDIHAAGVACRQLGLGHAVSHSKSPAITYGPGTGAVLLDDVICHGNESHLLRCIHSGLDTPTSCQHNVDVSLACSNVTTPYSGEVRLSSGSPAPLGSPSLSNTGGRVELYLRKQWGPLCSDGLGMREASSICRQLGYTNAESFRSVPSDGPFWIVPTTSCSTPRPCFTDCLDLLPVAMECSCPNNSALEIQCAFNLSLVDSESSGSSDLCTRIPTPTEPGTIRLTDPGGQKGQVEIFMNDEWGTICDMDFDFPEADVICKELGFPGALEYCNNFQGNGSMYTFTCSGIENRLMDCSPATIASSMPCNSVGVECSSIVPPYGSLALSGSAGSAGRLLINTGAEDVNEESSKPICDASFTLDDAHVACRQLGYAEASSVVQNSYYGSTSSSTDAPQFYRPRDAFACSGGEDHLLSCNTSRVGAELCQRGYDEVGIRCTSSSSSEDGRLRLVDGGTVVPGGIVVPRAVRLEVFLEDQWGSICGPVFDRLAAHVACQQLNYSTAVGFQLGGFGSSPGPTHLTSVRCWGSERTLLECAHHVGDGGAGCSDQMVVGIECASSSLTNGMLRVTDGNMSSGRLEVAYHGVWMSVCGRFFSEESADVACRQLGFNHAAEYCANASCFGEGDSLESIHVAKYHCRGNEQSLHECQSETYSSTLCDHTADVGIFCAISPSPPAPSLPSLARTTTMSRGSTATSTPVGPTGPIESEDSTPFFLPIPEVSFYVLVGVAVIVIVALIFAVTLCCFCAFKKKQQNWQPSRSRGATVNPANLTRGRDPIAAELASNSVKDDLAEDYDDPSLTVDSETIDPSTATKFSHGASNSIPSEPPPNYDELDFLPPHPTPYGSETKPGQM